MMTSSMIQDLASIDGWNRDIDSEYTEAAGDTGQPRARADLVFFLPANI